MKLPAPNPGLAAQRLKALEPYQILRTPPEAAFDRIVKLVGELFGVAEARINFLDDCVQWSKAFYGVDPAAVREITLEHSFCAQTLGAEQLIVLDTWQDPHFQDNPFSRGDPPLRFYAGAALKSSGGVPIGTLCLTDPEPRPAFGEAERLRLQAFTALVTDELELRRSVQMLAQTKAELGRAHIALATEMARLQEVTQALHRANEQLQHDATHDALTGLPNRAYFLERLGAAHRGQPPHPFALLFLDFDGFKRVNDTYGHTTGDALLVALARRLRDALKKDDLLARFGGDEFSVLLPCTDRGGALAAAERLRESFACPLELSSQETGNRETSNQETRRTLQLGVSIGVAVSEPPHPVLLEQLLQNADRAMYCAKKRGAQQGAVVLAEPA